MSKSIEEDLVTFSDEDFDRLHSVVYPNNIEEFDLSHEVAIEMYEAETGLSWYIHSEDLDKGTVTLKVLDKQKWFLAKIKYDL